jgi:hypothetical protein
VISAPGPTFAVSSVLDNLALKRIAAKYLILSYSDITYDTKFRATTD